MIEGNVYVVNSIVTTSDWRKLSESYDFKGLQAWV